MLSLQVWIILLLICFGKRLYTYLSPNNRYIRLHLGRTKKTLKSDPMDLRAQVSLIVNQWHNKLYINLAMRYFGVASVVLLFLKCKCVLNLECYQCSNLYDRGCYNYNLDIEHLKTCEEKNGAKPVCRLLTQLQYFTPSQEITLIRECAYIYTYPLQCVQSKFSRIHYSVSCECDEDGCNRGSVRSSTNVFFIFTAVICVQIGT